MTKNRLALMATLAFFLGCASAPLIETLFVPPLSAQQVAAGVQRWEHQCVVGSVGRTSAFAEEATDTGQRMGAEGWEMVLSARGGEVICFKRPLH